MKALINAIVAFLQAGITAGRIAISGDNTVTVHKGFWDDPQQVPFTIYPYIAIDDGGERVEDSGSDTAQTRIYSVIIAMGCYAFTKESSLDKILELADEVKAEFERVGNRQKDGHIWGITVAPFDWSDEKGFFRGRTVTIDFYDLETKYSEH